jgi:hypothetical protein
MHFGGVLTLHRRHPIDVARFQSQSKTGRGSATDECPQPGSMRGIIYPSTLGANPLATIDRITGGDIELMRWKSAFRKSETLMTIRILRLC